LIGFFPNAPDRTVRALARIFHSLRRRDDHFLLAVLITAVVKEYAG